MQNVNFKTVDEFLDFLQGDDLKVVKVLRQLVLDCIPDCVEKLSYNVPYYKRNSTICFIWPGCVAWGTSKREGVRFGFTSGHLMQDELNYLDKGERKQVYWKDFYKVKDIDVDLLKSYIFEAVIIDQEKLKRKQ